MLKRLNELTRKERNRLTMRMKRGILKKYIDEEGYLCYKEEELNTWQPRKAGRKIKI